MRLQPKMMSLGLGAGMMYLLDPEQGKRRRALMRDQMVHLGAVTTSRARGKARDLRNRTRGLTHQLGSHLQRDLVDDVVLHDRVRARLGRVVSHPAAIEVTCEEGCCTLGGPVLASERDTLLAAVSKVRGVCEVVDALDVHETGENVSALQGGGSLDRGSVDPFREGLFPVRPALPVKRVMAGALGTSLLVLGGGLLVRTLRNRGTAKDDPLASLRLRAQRTGGAYAPERFSREGLSTAGDSLMHDGGEPLASDHHDHDAGITHH